MLATNLISLADCSARDRLHAVIQVAAWARGWSVRRRLKRQAEERRRHAAAIVLQRIQRMRMTSYNPQWPWELSHQRKSVTDPQGHRSSLDATWVGAIMQMLQQQSLSTSDS